MRKVAIMCALWLGLVLPCLVFAIDVPQGWDRECVNVFSGQFRQLIPLPDSAHTLRRLFADPKVLQEGAGFSFVHDAEGRVCRIEQRSLDQQLVLDWLEMTYSGSDVAVAGSDGLTLTYQYDQAGRLSTVRWDDISWITYSYDTQGRMVQYERPDHSFVQVEYDLKGRVAKLLAPHGIDLTPVTIASYVYGVGYLDVYDALGAMTRYRFTGEHLTAVEAYGTTGQLYRADRFWWDANRLSAYALTDGQSNASYSYTFAYDGQENLVEEVFCGNLSGEGSAETESYATRWSYDALNRPITKREQNGLETRWIYLDDTSLVFSKTVIGADGLQLTTEYTYNSAGQVTSQAVEDPLDSSQKRIIERIYNGKHLVVEDEKSKSLYQLFDAAGHIKERYTTDSDGNALETWRYNYDSKGRVASIAEDAESILQYRYDAMGRVVQARDSVRKMGIKSLYDFAGRVVSRETTDGKRRVFHEGYTYDLVGRRVTDSDVYGNITRHEYDAFGREVRTLYPALEEDVYPVVSRAYDIHDRVIRQIDANGNATHTQYNARGQPVQITYSDGTEEHFRYDLDGSLLVKRARDGVEAHLTYDGFRRVVKQTIQGTEGEEITAAATYDAFKMLSVEDPLGHLTELKPTNVQETSKSCHECTSEWMDDFAHINALGQRVRQSKRVDDAGVVTTVTYNSMGLVAHVDIKDPFGQVVSETRKKYDLGGRLIQEANKTGPVGFDITEYVYGPMNRLECQTVHVGTSRAATTHWIYDAKGRVIGVAKPDGVHLLLEYDGLGRVKHLSSSDGSVDYRYTYDALHRPTMVFDAVHGTSVERAYHAEGGVSVDHQGSGVVVEREYDDSGRLSSVILPDRSRIGYQYDTEHLHAIERHSSDGTLTYTHSYTQWDAKGRPTKAVLLGDAGELVRRWDEQGRCVETTSKWWSQRLDAHDSAGRLVKARVWDMHGRCALQYAYDAAGRVIEDAGVMDRAYAYDPLGDRIETSERLFEDANGNVVVRDDAQLTYDALNRLISIRVPKQYDKTYTYDGLNRRLSETVTDAKGESTTHRFVYDDRREIGKVDERGALIELRLLGQGIAEDIGAAVAFEFKGVPYAPIHDYRGSVTALVSAQGRPVECYRYTAFGEEQIYNGSGEAITTRQSVNPWRYSSKRIDATTGLVHFGHRDYDAISGRWLTEDPLGTADGPNRHAFVRNNPLSFVDPQGLFSLSTLWEGVSKQFWHCADYVQDALGSISNTIENNFRVYDDIADDLRFVMREMIGPLFFTLVGLHNEDVEFGACGRGEFSDKVRVSYINGVLNNREAVMESAMQISECHGGVNVHFTFRPTGGLTRDVYNSLLRLLGYSSPASRRLAEGWRQLIDEMGGVDGRGLILHYAHSLGGAETDCARQLMSPEELQMIRVIAFGCPKVLRNEGFRHVQSYMGALDFVMVFGLFGYVDAMLSRSPHVIFLGHSGLSAWSDHLLNCPIYATKLVELGRRFVAMYDPRRRNDSYELLDYPER